MEVQWVGAEPPKLGPPHTAVGLIFSVLLGNVSHFFVTSFYSLHLHYVTADAQLLHICPFLKTLDCFPPSSLLNTKGLCQYHHVLIKLSNDAVAFPSLTLTFICFCP